MRLLSIQAENFRALKNFRVIFAQGYCTLSGKNNAGKSAVIRLLSIFFGGQHITHWSEANLDYKDDKTQWEKQQVPIKISYSIELTKDEDPALISFIEKIASTTITGPTVQFSMTYTATDGEPPKRSCAVAGVATDEKAAKEIDKRIKDSNLLFLYNSTTRGDDYWYGAGRRRMFYEFVMSGEERKEVAEAAKQLERRLKRLAREHKEALGGLLGRLTDRYDVEFSPLDAYSSQSMPLGINLKDRNVEIPLSDWGSGTQNRIRILMAVLQAARIKTTASAEEKITPIVVIEEPESFLHPSAQSEFGRLLRTLAAELGGQIIATTHSPYMLNQEHPSSNILLSRRVHRKKTYETFVVDTSGDNWMAPFSEHLGLPTGEFSSWRPLFSSHQSKVLLVEGPIDKEYFEYFQKHGATSECMAPDIEVVAYGGKDTLKNLMLLQFVLRKFDRVFVTYDLDADGDVRGSLIRLGLREHADFMPIGVNQPGKDCIEGLLPQRVVAAVTGRESSLVMQLASKHNNERRKAKDLLKKKYLEEFLSHKSYDKDELKELLKTVKAINARLCCTPKEAKAGARAITGAA